MNEGEAYACYFNERYFTCLAPKEPRKISDKSTSLDYFEHKFRHFNVYLIKAT